MAFCLWVSHSMVFLASFYMYLYQSLSFCGWQDSTRNLSNAVVVCCAVNMVGSDVWRAQLSVRMVDEHPPPVIVHGPANQTLPLKSIALLPCKSVGSPSPLIRWYKDGESLQTNHRIHVSEQGTLQIKGEFGSALVNLGAANGLAGVRWNTSASASVHVVAD